MAKSSTKRKYKIKPTQVRQLKQGIDQTVQYVNDWQRRELLAMALTKKAQTLPVCIPFDNNTYIVGQYGLERDNDLWLVTSSQDQQQTYFSTKLTALIYLICLQTGRHDLADTINKQDNSMINLAQELSSYKRGQKQAERKKDWWRFDYFNNLASNTEIKLSEAKNQLEKTIVLAKYFKIWE